MIDWFLGVGAVLVGAALYMLWPEGHRKWGFAFLGLGVACFIYAFILAKYPPTSITARQINYSSRQTLQVSNVPGDNKMTLNIDNDASLRLFPPFNREMVTLMWPLSPPTTFEHPPEPPGIEVRGLTSFRNGRTITFSLMHPANLIRVGDRIFRVTLESIQDKADKDRLMFFDYEFIISEVEPTAENRAAAISQ